MENAADLDFADALKNRRVEDEELRCILEKYYLTKIVAQDGIEPGNEITRMGNLFRDWI